MKTFILINPFVLFYRKYFLLFLLYPFFSIRIKMNWNIGENRNFFLKLISKLGLCHVALTILKTPPEKLTVTVVEMQQLPGIEKKESQEE